MFAASSLLFVPGSRPDRFAKARAAGAGMVAIDLEDAVAAADEDSARSAALDAIAAAPGDFALRINAVPTAAGVRDLAALCDHFARPAALLLPMVESAAEVGIVARALGEQCPPLIPLIETPRALRAALEIASSEGVEAVMFGGADFAAELGVALGWEPLLFARSQLVLACAEARVSAIDVPFVVLDDAAGLADECRRSRALGFSAKAAIHPALVAAIEAAFAPSSADIAEAEEALAAYREGGERAIRFKGRMLEAPLVKRYRAVLAQAKEAADA
jgi:citrate lyase subunit beta/citryl-CoA lyase/(S)-citramalyl-CoA lyase